MKTRRSQRGEETVYKTIIMPKRLHDVVKAKAMDDRRSVSNFIVTVLEDCLTDDSRESSGEARFPRVTPGR